MIGFSGIRSFEFLTEIILTSERSLKESELRVWRKSNSVIQLIADHADGK